MNSGLVAAFIGPNHLLLPIDFDQFHRLVASGVTGNHGIAIRQALSTAGVLQERTRKICIG